MFCFRTLDNIKDWLNNQKVGIIADRESSNQDQNNAYKYLVNRVVGYMAYKTVDVKSNIKSHEKLAGTQDAFVAENPGPVRESVHPESISSIFWSQAQMNVFQSKRPHVILSGDYGAGKTFLLKVIIQYLNIGSLEKIKM